MTSDGGKRQRDGEGERKSEIRREGRGKERKKHREVEKIVP